MPYLLLIALLFAEPAQAQFPGERWNEGLVLGAHVAIALGEVDGGRVGAGLDGWVQLQWYTEESGRFDGDFRVWAQEHPAWNYGPAAHVWKVGGHWHSSMGARFGVAWPLRVGLGRGWWPGPALTTELGAAISTSGRVGLDLQGAIDAPWTQARIGSVLGAGGLKESRLQLGVFSPLNRPVNWDNTTGDLWREPG